jgi:hypothetical protein
MAKKPRGDEDLDEDVVEEQSEPPKPKEEAPHHPGVPRIKVTYTGEKARDWYGILFEPGVATPVEHLPEHQWRAIVRDIDLAHGTSPWKYEYQIDPPPPPAPGPKAR